MKKQIQHMINLTIMLMLVLIPIQTQAVPLKNPIQVSLDQAIIGQGYISENGNTMIPLRILSEKLKYSVSWNNIDETATITKGNRYIELTVGYHNAKSNTGYIQLSSVPEMKNNTVYVPLKVVVQTLGLQIGYANRTAYISTTNEPIQLPTVSKQIPLSEVSTVLLSNGYEKLGSDDMSYVRRMINNEGEHYQISFSQVLPQMQLVTLSLHENNSENLAFAKLLFNSLVPTKATEIYHIISTQSIIPLTIIESDGYQVGLVAKEDASSLSITFDGSKDRKHIKALMIYEQ